jgi:L-alanine-DL-glutamate epimerase-like enolase superfamily enzyme
MMAARTLGPLALEVTLEQWPRATPVRITGHTYDVIHSVLVTLEKDGHRGRGEADVVYYRDRDSKAIADEVESLRPKIEAGMSRASLQALLPAGGARNALDCALWDLESKLLAEPVWKMADLDTPKPLITVCTCHAESPADMAEKARAFTGARAVKLKLKGEPIDRDRIRAVREALPRVWLGIDANQGFTPAFLDELMPTLLETRVALIEQPFPVGQEAWLDGFNSSIPIAADESVQGLDDIPALVGRFQVINIKLDKCGGLTEGLAMARAARAHGLEVMVGNMSGTSLAMAPAFILGQLCNVVDLDGPMLLKSDRENTVSYKDGFIDCPKVLWGGGASGLALGSGLLSDRT